MSEIAKLPLPDIPGKPKEPDWAWIEHEYRNGGRSLRDLARDAGISQPAISKRAKRDGWTRHSVITPVITATDNRPDNQAKPSRWEFEWVPENEDILMPSQQRTAVYENDWGQIVIRQEVEYETENAFVIIDKAHIPALIERMKQLMGQR